MYKICSVCKKTKSLGEFRLSVKGSSMACKECHKTGLVQNGYTKK